MLSDYRGGNAAKNHLSGRELRLNVYSMGIFGEPSGWSSSRKGDYGRKSEREANEEQPRFLKVSTCPTKARANGLHTRKTERSRKIQRNATTMQKTNAKIQSRGYIGTREEKGRGGVECSADAASQDAGSEQSGPRDTAYGACSRTANNSNGEEKIADKRKSHAKRAI